MYTGVSVDALQKATVDPHASYRVTVLRGLRPFEDENTNWITDRLLFKIQKSFPAVEIADLHLPGYRIQYGVSNDPDDKRFSSTDQFPALWDAIKSAEVLVVSAMESGGFPDSNTVRMCERMRAYKRSRKDKKLFDGTKTAVVVVSGGGGAAQAALTLSGAIGALGFVVAGVAFWDRERGKAKTNDDLEKKLICIAERVPSLVSAFHE